MAPAFVRGGFLPSQGQRRRDSPNHSRLTCARAAIVILSTIRIATALYVVSVALWLKRRDSPARLAWTLACAFFLMHVVAAFQLHHHWSNRSAYQETARQTAEVFGLDWGGGLYFNYLFTAVWIADAFWWWRSGLAGYRSRSAWVTVAVHSFFGFMFFNAAVVFGSGFMRCFGIASMLILTVIAASRTRPRLSK